MRVTLIGGLLIASAVFTQPATVQAQGAFTVSLSDSIEAVIVPNTIKLRDLTLLGHFNEPDAFREAVTRSILRTLEEDDSDLEIEDVIFYTLRIREMSGEHRELGFRIGNYATVEVRKKGHDPGSTPPSSQSEDEQKASRTRSASAVPSRSSKRYVTRTVGCSIASNRVMSLGVPMTTASH